MRYLFYYTGVFLIAFSSCNFRPYNKYNVAEDTQENYGAQIQKQAELFNLPASYLRALVVIEVSGNKQIPHRFEPHVYAKLKKVKNGELKRFENITPELLKNTPDSTLKEMAKSWGPYQIMGYKCVFLHISVEELKKNSLFFGARWIDLSYGDLLRAKDYKNAFHFHNAGKLYPDSGPPLTYDKNYVHNGLMYLRYFEKKDSIQRANKNRVNVRLTD